VYLSRWLFWRPPCLLRTVIVNLKSDPDLAIRGVLWQYRGAWLTVRQAQLLKAGAAALVLDGESIVHRENVAFLQVLP
jgi:hypothetical protein